MADTKLKLEVIMAAVDRITRPLKSLLDGSKATSGEVKALRDRIKDLNGQAGQIEAFRKLQSQTAVVGHNMTEAQAKVKRLADELNATSTPAKSLTRAFEAAKREANQLTTQHGEMTQRLQRQRDALNAAGLATTELASHQRRLKGEVASTTAALDAEQKKLEDINQRAAKVRAAQAQATKTRETAGKLATTGATMAVAGAALTAPVAKTVQDYSRFEDAMLGVARQVDGARDDNGKLTRTYYDMATEIKRLSTTIPLATTEIARIVEAGARMGIQGKENLLAFARTTAMTATAFGLPVEQVGEQMGKLAQLYKVPIPAISTLGDAINYLDDNALSKGGDIIDVMQRIAGTAAGVNMTAKEAAALGSTFLSLGARAEVAATASNAMIRELSIATMQPKRFQAGLQALGLNAKAIQSSMPKDATGTILMVLDKLKAVSGDKRLELATRLFGKEYGDDAAKLAENLDEYRRQLKLVNDEKAKGSMQREGDARNATLSAGGQILSNKFFNLTSALGETQRESVAAISQAIGGLLDRITAFVQANPGVAGAVVKTVSVLGGLLAIFGGLALAAAAVLGPFAMAQLALTTLGVSGITVAGAMGTVLGALKAVAMFLLTNPIGIAIAAIAALAGLVWSNWETIGPRFAALWDGIKSAAGAAWDWISQKSGTAWRFMADLPSRSSTLAGQIWSNWETIGPRFAALWDGIKSTAGAAWDWISQKAGTAWRFMADLFLNWTLPGLIIKHWDGITSFMTSLPTRFATIGGQIMDGLMGGLANRWESIKGWFAGMGGKIVEVTKNILGIKSPSRVFASIGSDVMAGLGIGLEGGEDGPLAQARATASKLASIGGAMAIGVSGAMPAMAKALEPIAIDARPPLSATAATAGAGQAPTVVNHITINAAPGMDEKTLARLVATEIERASQRQQAARRSRLTDDN